MLANITNLSICAPGILCEGGIDITLSVCLYVYLSLSVRTQKKTDKLY